jgi:hypothetical protein
MQSFSCWLPSQKYRAFLFCHGCVIVRTKWLFLLQWKTIVLLSSFVHDHLTQLPSTVYQRKTLGLCMQVSKFDVWTLASIFNHQKYTTKKNCYYSTDESDSFTQCVSMFVHLIKLYECT